MILDSSAVVAVFLKEPGAEDLVTRLGPARGVGIGAPTLVEAGIVLTARMGEHAQALLSQFLTEFGIVTVPFGEEHWRAAVEAYRRFGKGRHAAALDFGDCMSYATAKLSRQPLLCTGRDFAGTDLAIA
ncbi:MAG TPA: type II toxin-antitoxin system VapC family toxin [Candidatus Binatia bacterium]|nr:type II toxin-antitoxin system VapC family toxin [Candidatus Binatia bacterium]